MTSTNPINFMLLTALCVSLSCDRDNRDAGRNNPKATRETTGAIQSEAEILFSGTLSSRFAVDAVPWTSPARNGSNYLFLSGSVGAVDIRFEEGERLEVTAQMVAFAQMSGELNQVDVALVDMNKNEAADAVDRLATSWQMDKTRLTNWKEAGMPDFPKTGFFVEKAHPTHFTTVEIGPSYDPYKPYVVHFTYVWKSTEDIEMLKRGR